MRVQIHTITNKTWLLPLAVICYLLPALSVARDIPITVSNPERAYGYTIGDVLEQKVALHEGDVVHVLQELPDIQREGRWITRQQAEVSDDAQWLSIRYQIINSPASVRIISLPGLTLNTEQEQQIHVPPWSFSVAPLTPAAPAAENPLPIMQPDWRAESPASITLWRNIQLLLACLILTVLLWFIWWFSRGIADARSLPFARAFRIIRQHKGGDAAQTTSNWLALHRAFDQLSGKSMGRDSVEALVNNTRWLTPFQRDIHAFYKASSTRFFSTAPSVGKSCDAMGDAMHESFDLFHFAQQLHLAEKKHTGNAVIAYPKAVDGP